MWAPRSLPISQDAMAIAIACHRYFDDQHLEMIYGDGFDARNLIEADPSRIRTWSDLVAYNQSFLNGTIPRTIFHDGVYASETLLILDALQAIHAAGFLTLDSQPGCVIQHGTGYLLQLPYLHVMGPLSQLQQIGADLDSSIVIWQPLKDVTSTLRSKLEHLQLDQPYGSIYFTINTLDIADICSNRFFDQIVQWIQQQSHKHPIPSHVQLQAKTRQRNSRSKHAQIPHI